MNNLKMFCITLEPNHLDYITNLNYTPVGLGDKIFPGSCLSDKKGENISNKNIQILNFLQNSKRIFHP